MSSQKQYIGCLLGLAAGDALGYSVDDKSWEQIRQDYGPNGLLGYDLQEEYAQVTSYTQIAAYLCNGLLLSISRGSRDKRLPYVSVGLREWTRSQLFYRDPERSFCWIAKLPAFRRRHCRDARMLDILRLQSQGATNVGTAFSDSPGPITAGIAVGLFYEPRRMEPEDIGRLAYETVKLTHGKGEAALCATVLSYIIAGLLQSPDVPLEQQLRGAIAAMQGLYPGEEAQRLGTILQNALTLAQDTSISTQEAMEQLDCHTAARCLAGGMYAAVSAEKNFDEALITAVNHSGHSAATGAITGAILGSKLGVDSLPEFYLESLEIVDSLTTLALDLRSATPASGIFDDDWDQKYVQGEPL